MDLKFGIFKNEFLPVVFSVLINGCAKDYFSQVNQTDMYADFT